MYLLTSSSVEMAAKDGNGIFIDLSKVPVRELNMSPFELMLSESQERMLMVIHPGSEKKAEKIFKKWELDFQIIGEVTNSKNLILPPFPCSLPRLLQLPVYRYTGMPVYRYTGI